MQNEMPANELAAKLMADMDDLHNEELDDMLKDLFALRAKELKANMLALAENEANSKALIAKNMKARKKAVKELHDKLDEKVETEDPEALGSQKKA
jgi:phage-related protein